jgi:hypothetical protein
MKKISILGTIIFAGTLLISPDAAEAKSKQKLRASEDIGEKSEKHSNKKRSKRKISSNVRITHAKKDESKIYSRKAEKKKIRKRTISGNMK